MNKLLLWLLAVTFLSQTTACRRRQASPATLPTVTTTADSLRSDSTRVAARPDSTGNQPAESVGPARPGIAEAITNVAEVDFRFLTARSKIDFKSKTQDIDNANVSLRARKDSLIWLSVSKLGLEVARVLITRDSVMILDKFHGEYVAYDFPALSRQFNFDMNFNLLQALIVGNLPLPKQPAQKVKNERDYLLLRQTEGKVLVENYIGEDNRKLKRLMLTEQPTKNTLRLDYDDFNRLNNFLFPYTSLATVDYRSQTDGQFYQTLLRIKHQRVELTDKDPGFPFSVPARYQRR